jgi:hypothetical protein
MVSALAASTRSLAEAALCLPDIWCLRSAWLAAGAAGYDVLQVCRQFNFNDFGTL